MFKVLKLAALSAGLAAALVLATDGGRSAPTAGVAQLSDDGAAAAAPAPRLAPPIAEDCPEGGAIFLPLDACAAPAALRSAGGASASHRAS
jgi:hypothetical protein